MEEKQESPSEVLSGWLTDFCSSEEDRRRHMRKPARKDGFAYASNGKIAVRVKLRDDETGGPNGDFSDIAEDVDALAGSLDKIIKANWELGKDEVSVQGLDLDLYRAFNAKKQFAMENYTPNSRGLERFRCPCCSASLYYDDDEQELVECWKRDEEEGALLTNRIVVAVNLQGMNYRSTYYYCAENVAAVIKFAALRKSPIKDAWVCGGHCLMLRGEDWEAIMTRWPEDKSLSVIHSLPGKGQKTEKQI